MKVKTSAVVLAIVSAIVVIAGVGYYNYVLPVLDFLYNGDKDVGNNESVDIGNGTVLDVPPADPQATPGDSTSTNSEYAPKIPESNINVLLLGVDDSAGLTDTICVLSVNQQAHTIQLISIPRDAYVPYNASVNNALKNAGLYYSPGIMKINAAPNIGRSIVHYTGGNFQDRGVNFLCSIIQNLLGYRIDEYVSVNFEGFKDVVDAFGGLDITVEEDMYTYYGDLALSKGVHKLNGEMALFYARARHRYNDKGQDLGSPGDSYRKSHQLNMLTEMGKQVVTADNIINMKSILESLSKAINHSFNLDNLGGYMNIGLDYAGGQYQVETILIEGDDINPMGDGVSYCKIYN